MTHSILQLICRDDESRRNAQRIHELAPYIDGRLRGLGVAADDRLAAQTTIIAAAVAVVNSERGRWIMDDRHRDAASEYALTSVLNGRAVNIIIDRTFIDSVGLRWIIDFKTGTHSGGAKATFIDTEVERYRPQLERYAQLMKRQDPRPIALGLHFPLLDAWREWRYSGND